MAIRKHLYPLLEFDDQKRAVIEPDHEGLDIRFPPKCAFVFLGDYVDEFARKHQAKVLAHFISATKKFPIYQIEHKGETICLVQAPVGSSPSGQLMDWLISYGVREIISTGTCGTLVDWPAGYFIVPNRALRDEGTSYHYLPASRYVDLHPLALKAIEETMLAHSLHYQEVMTWTTDGFYRETPDLVSYRIEEGCQVVEMECSALAAVAQFRGVIFGQVLYTADSLADIDQYDQRDWGETVKKYSLDLAMDCLLSIKEG
ncbi:phosphorylase [Atopobacter sp. AH10]|uniref:nucleoside phosphorylase n=1 Tax=Atopobacter sp. AH10 TaxID=2315861 RepID=UPI000EF1B0F5|nr:nucleoside phosphorylase [Atopobacter sp. AH10]RLK63506.1 phosphorylase [Atopobacter sp. AH10]